MVDSKDRHPYKESIKKNRYTVINCEQCGYWHVYPVPTEEELHTYYQTKYYETLGNNRTMTDKLDDSDGFYSMQYEDRLRYITKILPTDLPKTVLDIGAGYGDFLRFMMKNGWETQGVEPSQYAYELIKDKKILNIKNGDIDKLLDMVFKPSSVVTLNNVLEHLREPQKVLEIIKKLLLPKGILCIVVPNDFNILQNVLMKTVLKGNPGKQYYWVCPLDHLNYWSPETIKHFLKKCGFEISYFTTDFPMEIFPLIGEDYITYPDIGRNVHLKRVRFEKYFHETKSEEFKNLLFESFAKAGVGRDMLIFAMIQ